MRLYYVTVGISEFSPSSVLDEFLGDVSDVRPQGSHWSSRLQT